MKAPVQGDGSLLKSDIVMTVQLGKFTQNHEIVYLKWVDLWYVNHFSIKFFLIKRNLTEIKDLNLSEKEMRTK